MPGDSWQRQLWSDLIADIGAVWPEVLTAGGIWREMQIDHIDWKNRIVNGKLAAPWCVVLWPKAERDTEYSGATNEAWRVAFTVVYFQKLGADGSTDLVDTLQQKLADLQAQIIASLATKYNVLPDEEDAFDTSAANPGNATMVEQQLPFACGSYSFACIAGYRA